MLTPYRPKLHCRQNPLPAAGFFGGEKCMGDCSWGGWLKVLTFFLVASCSIAATTSNPPKYHRFEPLSPAESLQKVRVPPGYRVEIVAAEPMVQEPVYIAWDPNGAMYVAEMNSYMQDVVGTGTKTQRNGRIKRLTDTDGDGIMDRATVFVDQLLLPRMILALDERILVQETDSTAIVAYRDTDHDGVADERTVLYEGVPIAASVEHQDSALTWNLDNWMYTAQGGLRFRYTRGRWETERVFEQLSNQWGLGMDDTGMMFYSTNHVPGRSFNQHWYYWNLIGEKKKWARFMRPDIGPETDAAFQATYRTQPIGDRSDAARTTWTSACGISIYRGDALPDEVYGSLLLAEPCAHAVRRGVITREPDGRRTLKNPYPAAEFFMSEDFYCRPVSTHTGPDGCIYIVDMYRGIIQDAPWVSPQFAVRIKGMGADQVKNRGRIYRISHENVSPGPRPRLLEAKPAEWVGYLAHANGWWRDTAQRLVILRGDKSVVPLLETMAQSHANPLARLHALWTLDGLDALRPTLLVEKLHDEDYRLRAAAVRLHEPLLRRPDGARVVDRLAGLQTDPDPEVRRQVILSLGWSRDRRAQDVIQTIATAEPANAIITLAALTALYGRDDLPLVKQARDGTLFQKISNMDEQTQARTLWQAGLDAWKEAGTRARNRDEAVQASIDRGARIYEETCATCHGANGQGVTVPGGGALAPALAKSPRVTGSKEALVRILLHGLTGPIDGRNYETGQMASLGAASPDAWTASVLSYIRQAWTNEASPIEQLDVARIRTADGARATPWTLAELSRFEEPLLTNRKGWVATAIGHIAGNAIDGVVDATHQHAWYGTNNPGAWLAVDLGKTFRLTQLVMVAPEQEWAPRGFQVEVSDDGVAWRAPIAQRGNNPLQLRTVASFEPTVTRHIRITQTGNSIERWVVSELEIYGAPAGER